jgi:hypothetical protein
VQLNVAERGLRLDVARAGLHDHLAIGNGPLRVSALRALPRVDVLASNNTIASDGGAPAVAPASTFAGTGTRSR